MQAFIERVKIQFANVHTLIPSGKQDWALAIFLTLLTLFPALVKWIFFIYLPSFWSVRANPTQPSPISYQTTNWFLTLNNQISEHASTLKGLPWNDPTFVLAFYVWSSILAVAVPMLLISFAVFMIVPPNHPRGKTAGRFVKWALTLIVTSGGSVCVYLGAKA